MKKRLIVTLLTLIALVGMMTIAASAAEIVASGTCTDNIYWTLDQDGVFTVSGTGEMQNCYDLSNGQWKNRDWHDYLDDITAVVIEDGITYVGSNTFRSAPNLRSVTIADSVESIGSSAFSNCDSLTEISLGTGLKSTEDFIFYDCDALTDFVFPDANVEYGGSMFASCNKLENVTLSKELTTITGRMFEACALKEIELPSGLTKIGPSAFSRCGNLREVTVPEGVLEISKSAFASCLSLQSISLPDSLTKMGSNVFAYCQQLKRVTVPANVKTMGHTFNQATALKTVTFLGNSPVCDGNLFGGITVTAYYPQNNKTWTEHARQDYGGTVTWKGYISDLTPNYLIDSGVCGDSVNWKLDAYTLVIYGTGDMYDFPSAIPWADYWNKIESVVIESGVTSVGNRAFSDCRALTSITIGDTVTRLGDSCMHNCVLLPELTIPSSVTQIGHSAFSGCIGLNTVQFSGDAPSAESSIFRDITTTVCYPACNPTWTEDVWQDHGGTIIWEPYEFHTYEAVMTLSTCSVGGYTTYTCIHCSESYVDDETPTIPHTWSEGSCEAPRTCTVCGAASGEIHGHIYDNNVDGSCAYCDVPRQDVEYRQVVHMFRMYNPNTGEHFYTGSEVERDNLIESGWQYEGIGFTFPANTGAPVYRLFQPSTGEHLYTMDEAEKDALLVAGWNYEGIAFNSAYDTEAVQHRLRNPNTTVGAYHFTFSLEEKDNLIAAGWIYEGIGWYSCWK